MLKKTPTYACAHPTMEKEIFSLPAVQLLYERTHQHVTAKQKVKEGTKASLNRLENTLVEDLRGAA